MELYRSCGVKVPCTFRLQFSASVLSILSCDLVLYTIILLCTCALEVVSHSPDPCSPPFFKCDITIEKWRRAWIWATLDYIRGVRTLMYLHGWVDG